MKAIAAVEKEEGLDIEDAIEFIHALTENKVFVDTYNSFTTAVICRWFIETTLKKHHRN